MKIIMPAQRISQKNLDFKHKLGAFLQAYGVSKKRLFLLHLWNKYEFLYM
jgi:hypothetical protein